MSEADWIWAALILAGAAFEGYALRNGRAGDTLSESTRRWFHVRHPVGRVAFGVAWTLFAAWFGWHILFE